MLTERLLALPHHHPLRVAVDGIDAAGKTRLADALAVSLRAASPRPILRASLDHFHHPRALRYRQGPDSAQGYYADSFDLPALRDHLLNPLGPGGSRQIRLQHFDHLADAPVACAPITAAEEAILLVDGIFLQRPELRGCWEHVIFVQVGFETALERALQRDLPVLGSPEAIHARYCQRYIPAQQRYLAECRPAERAATLIDNNDPLHPILIR